MQTNHTLILVSLQKLHRKRTSIQHSKIHFLLTQNLCPQQVGITDICQILPLATPSAPPSLQTKPSSKLADLSGSVSLSQGLFHLGCWASALAGNRGEQYLAGRGEGLPITVGKVLTTAALPSPLLLLTFRGNHHHPATSHHGTN